MARCLVVKCTTPIVIYEFIFSFLARWGQRVPILLLLLWLSRADPIDLLLKESVAVEID